MIEGEVARIERSSICGWAISPTDAGDCLLIEAFVRGRLRGSTLADRSVPDLPALANGHAEHGFVIEFNRPLRDDELAELELYATAASGERAPLGFDRNHSAAAPALVERSDGWSVAHPQRAAADSSIVAPPAAIPVEERIRAFLDSLTAARTGLEAALRDLAAGAAHEGEYRTRYEAAERDAEQLRARLDEALSAREEADAAGRAAEDAARCMAAALRELSAPAVAGDDPVGVATPATAGPPVEADEEAPNFAEYWLPDPLREYIIDRFGDKAVGSVHAMMAIVARHELNRAGFAGSYDCRALQRRLRAAAAPDEGEPVDVSIVMPVYNGLVYTLTCLASLFALPTRHRFEVIVGDNASDDGTAAVVPSIGGRVRYIRHRENLGFLLNCNLSARAARGRWIVLLNNDTIILPGWLDALIDTFGRDERIGYVGSKLLNGDGSLQEAGGIFWSDGSAWNYGRGQDPRLPEFNYVKDADYCSGAAIAVPKVVWDRMGGFDPHYVPAYCEDSDLAFRLRAAGLRTLYQPLAEIIHHEGKAHGTDTTSGIKAYQIVNGRKLYERWRPVLGSEHWPNGEHVLLARDRSRLRPHLLVVDHYVPQWDQDAGSRTIYAYLRCFLGQGFQISFWPDNLYRDPVYTEPLQQLGVEVLYSTHYSGKFAEWMARNGDSIDYVLLSRANVAVNYIDAVRANSAARILYYGHDLPWRRLMQEYLLTRDAAKMAEADAAQRLEDAVCRAVDVALYPTEEECRLARERVPQREIAAVPAYVYAPADLMTAHARLDGSRARERYRLLFVGGFAHPPNSDAVAWFTAEVLPLLKARNNRFRLTVVGSNPPPEIRKLDGRSVTVTGKIDDAALAELYRTADAAVVPLRAGAGIKGKVIEAFAMGTPVVSTSVGMQGIPDAERLALVADEPGEFAARIAEIGTDPKAAAERARNALAYVAEHFSETAILAALRPHIPALSERSQPAARVAPGDRFDGRD